MRPRTKGPVIRQQPSFNLNVGPSPLHHRHKPPTLAPVAVLGRQTLTQHHNLPYANRSTRKRHAPDSPPPSQQQENDFVSEGCTDWSTAVYDIPDGISSRTRCRRATQWKRWQEGIIPLLIKPYMNLMATTDSLRHQVNEPSVYDCRCHGSHELSIKVVRFSEIEEIILRKCGIHKIAPQLVQRGLFPCAPLAPTLAVDMKTLEFVRALFLRVSPNVTAISNTLEDCLGALGYKLETIVSSFYVCGAES